VDKDASGNYLISGRHVKTIYKINGTDGSLIWSLGGKNSSFTMDYEFNFQHHARYRTENGSITTISLYDDGSDDDPPPPGTTKPGYEAYSSGVVATIDTSNMSSSIIQRYISPQLFLSGSQGNLQYLPNGNWYMGMGSLTYALEFADNSTGDGQVVYEAYLQNDSGAFSSYRNFKFNWTGTPAAPPDLFVYAESCTANPVFYVSWNGATEVTSWRFVEYNNQTRYSVSHPVGSATKTGFETNATFSSGFIQYSYVEALGSHAQVLSQSAIVKTFVPASSISGCTATSCGTALNYTTAAQTTCTTSTEHNSPFDDRPSG
jgi:hypothetical protein